YYQCVIDESNLFSSGKWETKGTTFLQFNLSSLTPWTCGVIFFKRAKWLKSRDWLEIASIIAQDIIPTLEIAESGHDVLTDYFEQWNSG
ncbi:MAG: hypothetical protein OXC82_08105, partial [Rhodobacteraceae bacterium]|nr:hypothetical protein [Paracoccaceae bacterium]